MQYTLEFALFWFILFQNLIRNSNIIKYSDYLNCFNKEFTKIISCKLF